MIWLFLLGILTYFIVQRSVAGITRTPVWLLWLVMMMPVFVWAGWVMVRGNDTEPIPPIILLGPLVVAPVLYWFLVQLGRRPPSPEMQQRRQEMQAALANAIAPPQKTSPLNKEEEAELQNCFPWSIFYLQNIEHRPQALICRGQLRTSPEVAYKTIRENIENLFSDRFLVLFQEEFNGKPFFALIPNPQAQPATQPATQPAPTTPVATKPITRPGIAILLLLVTLMTTTVAGVVMLNPVSSLRQSIPAAELLTGLPYALALMGILGVHELGHYLAARRYQIRATLPYFIPIPPATFFPYGTFGAFIQLRSPVPNRQALFDVGIAGPLAGFVITIPVLLWGLAQSTVLTPQMLTNLAKIANLSHEKFLERAGLLNFNLFQPNDSLLLSMLSKLALGNQLQADSLLDLHPVAIAGCLGLIITALNLMPVGQLDGGHIVHAMFGQRNGALIGQIARFLVLALAFVQQEFFLWALLLFFMPVVDEPALNDVSELDNKRDLLGLLALVLLVAIVLPAPKVLLQFLF